MEGYEVKGSGRGEIEEGDEVLEGQVKKGVKIEEEEGT